MGNLARVIPDLTEEFKGTTVANVEISPISDVRAEIWKLDARSTPQLGCMKVNWHKISTANIDLCDSY